MVKLIFCPQCHDVVKLRKTPAVSTCECGRSSGFYHGDGLRATILGDAVPLGFGNQSFSRALASPGAEFTAFTILMPCPTIEKKS